MHSDRWTFIIAAICGVTGILVTYFFVPDMTGVDLADEDEKFLKYLADNGWEGEVGDDEEQGASQRRRGLSRRQAMPAVGHVATHMIGSLLFGFPSFRACLLE